MAGDGQAGPTSPGHAASIPGCGGVGVDVPGVWRLVPPELGAAVAPPGLAGPGPDVAAAAAPRAQKITPNAARAIKLRIIALLQTTIRACPADHPGTLSNVPPP